MSNLYECVLKCILSVEITLSNTSKRTPGGHKKIARTSNVRRTIFQVELKRVSLGVRKVTVAIIVEI